MASLDIYKLVAIVHEMCTEVTREAIAEIDAEDMKSETTVEAEPSPVQMVCGRKEPQLVRHSPASAKRTQTFTVKWRQFLATSSKTCCDVSTLNSRDVSMTKRWVECSPEMEDQDLRQKHGQRVNSWRNLLTTTNKESYFPGVFRYKATKSLLDFLCPIKKMRLEDLFEIIDLKDIIPKIVIDFCEDVVEVTSKVTGEEVLSCPLGGSTKKQRRNRFLCCFRQLTI